MMSMKLENDELEEEGIRCLSWGWRGGEGQGVLPMFVAEASDFGFKKLEERPPMKIDDDLAIVPKGVSSDFTRYSHSEFQGRTTMPSFPLWH